MFAPTEAGERDKDTDNSGVGSLLRLFDMMMIVLKLAVLAKLDKEFGNKERQHHVDGYISMLTTFDHQLGVLREDPERKQKTAAEYAISFVYEKLVGKDHAQYHWLLAPQWALDDDKRSVVRKFLNIR